jgi:prepilin-type N-terminal cleavage/methylation domain-containing protein
MFELVLCSRDSLARPLERFASRIIRNVNRFPLSQFQSGPNGLETYADQAAVGPIPKWDFFRPRGSSFGRIPPPALCRIVRPKTWTEIKLGSQRICDLRQSGRGSHFQMGPLFRSNFKRGFSLMELVVVVAILAIIASLALPLLGSASENAKETAAKATMGAIREAILGSPTIPGYLADMKYVPGFKPAQLKIHDLMDPSRHPHFTNFDPIAERGWRGPYLHNTQPVSNTDKARAGRFPAAFERRFVGDRTFLNRNFFQDSSTSVYGSADDEAVADPWGNPIVIQIPNDDFLYARLVSAGKNGKLDTPPNVLTVSNRGDDLVFFLNRSDEP